MTTIGDIRVGAVTFLCICPRANDNQRLRHEKKQGAFPGEELIKLKQAIHTSLSQGAAAWREDTEWDCKVNGDCSPIMLSLSRRRRREISSNPERWHGDRFNSPDRILFGIHGVYPKVE